MKKIAILVIAALNQPVYIHYIKNYWLEVINYTNNVKPNVDVFLLLENGTAMDVFSDIPNNIIEDKNTDLDQLCAPQYQSAHVPGILSKTIYALELLHDQYDVFFRTNLSSMIKISAFEEYVQTKNFIGYSGAWTWTNALRETLLFNNKVGPQKSIKTLDELEKYEGDTFVSGAGYFLNAEEATNLVNRKQQLRYDMADDVAVGLMFAKHETLKHFSAIVEPQMSLDQIMHIIRTSDVPHIRLQHFPLNIAQAIWHELEHDAIWK